MKTKTIYVKDKERLKLSEYPNFNKNGSIVGMKNKYYGKNALLVRCGNWIYNVSDSPEIYDQAH